jgi:hypothetical protein
MSDAKKTKKIINKISNKIKDKKIWLFTSIGYLLIAIFFVFLFGSVISSKDEANSQVVKKIPSLDKVGYDRRMNLLAHLSATSTNLLATSSTSTKKILWPVKTDYPNAGAILPFNRIVAYYGNLLSTSMGVLGQYPEDEMLSKLQNEVQKWTLADPETPAIPALDYIVVTAQGSPGDEGKYRLRMPDTEIDKVMAMAKKINALIFLDIQVGQSTIEEELPLLEKYIEMPNVHIAIDPEFSMKYGRLPGDYVGTYDAAEINYVINYLAKVVDDNNLTPKILVVHRYTENMVTNYQNIEPVPEVQVVMDMDGWGPRSNKLATYQNYINKEPVQFTGFKLFYKNDIHLPGTILMTPEEILKLTPQPVYIQYQ